MRTKGFKTLVALFMFMMISALPATTMNFLAQDSVPSINSSSSNYHELDNLSSDLLLAANYPGAISMVEENIGDSINQNLNNSNIVYPTQVETSGLGNPNYNNSNLVYPHRSTENGEPLTLGATYGNESSSGMEKVAYSSSSYEYPNLRYSFRAFLDRYTEKVSYAYPSTVAMNDDSDEIVYLNGTYGNAPSYVAPETESTIKDTFSESYDSVKSIFDNISDAIYDMMPNN